MKKIKLTETHMNIMNKKQKQVLAEIQAWYEQEKNNLFWCKTAEDVVLLYGDEKMMNAMFRAGYKWTSMNDVKLMNQRGLKFIDTMIENLTI